MNSKFKFSDKNSLVRRNFTVQIKRLDRNERDIALFKKQLSSYLVEPKTHENFTLFYKLKTEVKYLENSCTFIYLRIRTNIKELNEISNLIDIHLERTKLLADNISIYLDKIKETDLSLKLKMSS